MEISKQVIYGRCSLSVPVSDVRYIQDKKKGHIMLCSACRGNTNKGDSKEKSEDKIKKEIPKKAYNCSRCSYDFKISQSDRLRATCPYCGKSDKIKEIKIIPIDSIIKNIIF